MNGDPLHKLMRGGVDMYKEFAIWLTDLEAYKIGQLMGFFMGLLSYFIITAVVEYAIDLFNQKRKKKD